MQITEGRIVSPIKVEGRHAIVREVEVDAIVDLGTAVALRDWLSNMIGIMESINKKEG
jgi:hypothetical protein